MTTDAPIDRTTLARATLEALSDEELDRLTPLLLELEAKSRSAWKDAAVRYGLRRSPSHALTVKDLEPLMERLEAAGVLVSTHGPSHFSIPTEMALHGLATAHARGRLAGFAESFERLHAKGNHFWEVSRHITRLRLAVMLGTPGAVEQVIARSFLRGPKAIVELLVDALGAEPRASWLPHLPQDARVPYLHHVCEIARLQLLPVEDSILEAALAQNDKKLRLEVARILVLRGEGSKAAALRPLPRWGAEGIAVLEAFWRGDYAEATARGHAAVVAMKSRKHPVLADMEGACHMLSAVATCASDPRQAAELGALLVSATQSRSVDEGICFALRDVYDALTTANPHPLIAPPMRYVHWFLPSMVWLLHELWLNDGKEAAREPTEQESTKRKSTKRKSAKQGASPGRARARPSDMLPFARAWHERAVSGGYAPVERELAAIITALEGGTMEQLAGAFDPPAPWETALASLEAAVEGSVQAAGPAASQPQLVWRLATSQAGHVEIEARILSSTRATKGKSVSLTRLLEGAHAELLDASDHAVLATVDVSSWPGLGPMRPVLGREALVALIGHPRVVSSSGLSLVVERGSPTIVTRQREGQTLVELRPPALLEHEVCFEVPKAERLVVYERPPSLEPLIAVLARGRSLEVPAAARDRLARVLTRLGATSAVAIEGDLDVGARSQPADARTLLQLGWDGSTLEVRVRVAPLGPRGPHLQPGAGIASLLGEIIGPEGTTLARCERDLGLELERHRAVLDACPILAGFTHTPLHHSAPSLPDALDVLLEIDALGDDVVLAWAAGQKLDLPLRADLRHLQVQVGSGTDWLSLSGSMQLDEGAVLRFAELLGRPAGARYVPVGRGRFVALSDKLRRHLDALGSLGTTHGAGKNAALRVSPALLSVLDELASQTEGFALDEAARAKLVAMRELEHWVPRAPRGFQATLRDYQREGYVWMSRLGRAGLGACLADDMGLGKTVQALALLCQRASLGPALVVCPTSVVLNWVAEATRFAPTLRVHVLADAGDRSERLRTLRPRDVVVCSYGLLSSEADALAELELGTVVFDEAHALKNQTTKRAKSARRLRAGFRLALTGTPVENHLGELWSLFDVISPGLLASRSHFDDRFTAPIAAGDRERTSLLRAILRPFMLRRTKAQVLDELPPRSEITIRVEPSAAQRAFYEALRRSAQDRIATADPKKARFEILAEITRLRQAAIDPRIVDEAAGPAGAKIDVLIDRLEQLREEGHRALVFTQFLGSMALVRERLASSGIEWFELDGSTSTAERARRIEAFQAGEGDVFLLSLRAGGTGVNLTGADYVFHLDPWWNPAVEDQATDRAHRIGQQRPVTIYRLVTEGTIEDKIVALHGTKRQLADDVLSGLERATAPDLEQLRRLLEEA